MLFMFLLAHEALIFPFGHAIEIRRDLHDAGAIEYDDLISGVVYKLLPLEPLYRLCNASPPHSQHQRQKLMRKRDRVIARSIVGHQNPSCQTLVNMSKRIRDGSMRGLYHESLREFK